MLVHQYELFRMKEDESIETMYSRFQTLVSGLQILKKSYVASDHVNKILRSLPAKWRPKVTTIEEAKDLSTLRVEDLISSLKCHEIGLNVFSKLLMCLRRFAQRVLAFLLFYYMCSLFFKSLSLFIEDLRDVEN